MPEAVRIEERDDRIVAMLDRPEVRNAIDQAMVDELHALCDRLERSPPRSWDSAPCRRPRRRWPRAV